MKARMGVVLAIGCVGIGTILWQVGSASGDSGVVPSAVAIATSMPVLGGDGPTYVGSSKCKMCHIKQNKSWKKGKKAKALESLKPGHADDIKTKHGLDPGKDYTTDESCLACHTTGYGQAGGFAIPDPSDKKAVKRAKKLAGVGCESCHGPGSEYIKLHKEILKSKRKYKVEEMYAAGMFKIEESTCVTCHNDKNPTFEGFDFAAMKEQGAHDHFELKQREN